MLSEKIKKYAEEKFILRREVLKEIYEDIEYKLKGCTEDESVLMKFLYGTMPIRDAGEYEFDLFLAYVNHAIWLRENIKYAKNLSEGIFLNYILYPRINSENIVDCRAYFYNELKDRIKDKKLEDAVIEINYWCAENVTYQTTDGRTMSPIATYKACAGRCGEESTFAVTAMRSVGIPARQVYTPWWAHCDDNHAWVEVYISGKWYFLGACEPEEELNRSWFLEASTRALLVYARTFSDFMDDSNEECITKYGGLVYYNSTDNYADTRVLTIIALDKTGNPVKEAEISLEILNMARFSNITTLFTDSDGKAKIAIGKGDINIRAIKDNHFGERLVKLSEGDIVKIILDNDLNKKTFVTDRWNEIDIAAPIEKSISQASMSEEKKKRNRLRIKESSEKRKEKEKLYYNKEHAEKFPDEKEILSIAKGNFDEIYSFLSKNDDYRRKEILKTLTVKDYRDLKADVLESHLITEKGNLNDEIYFKYVLCPRVYLEEMTAFRSYIMSYFDNEIKEKFKKNPYHIWEYIEKNIEYVPEFDYKTIYSTPLGCLKLKKGNPVSKKILFVAICRTLGIPSYLDRATLEPKYWFGEKFISLSINKIGAGEMSELILKVEDGTKWNYYINYTIGVLRNDRFLTLDYENIKFMGNSLRLKLDSGIYRLINTFRMPNGNQKAKEITFYLSVGEKKTIEMQQRDLSMRDMLTENKLADFELMDEKGIEHKFSNIIKNGSGILAFLDEGKEPTEHILNEMTVASKELKDIKIIFIIRDKEALKNPTIKKTMSALPKIQVYYDREFANVELLARKMYIDPEKLPLIIALKDGLTGIYGCSGYNVGTIDLIRQVTSYKE